MKIISEKIIADSRDRPIKENKKATPASLVPRPENDMGKTLASAIIGSIITAM